MSGRFTFTAGNTLTAAQLNSNIMDGLLYKTVTGTVDVPMVSASPWSSGSANVTGVTGFTQNPYVYVSINTSVNIPILATAEVTSTSAFTIRCHYYGSSATARTVRWLAVQATSSNSAGS
jgi:hypothetical protein